MHLYIIIYNFNDLSLWLPGLPEHARSSEIESGHGVHASVIQKPSTTTEVQRWRPWSMGRWQRWACGMDMDHVKLWNSEILWFLLYLYDSVCTYEIIIWKSSASHWRYVQILPGKGNEKGDKGYEKGDKGRKAGVCSALQEWTPQTAWNLIPWTDELIWTVWLSRHAIIHSVGYEQVLSITFSCNVIMCICKWILQNFRVVGE